MTFWSRPATMEAMNTTHTDLWASAKVRGLWWRAEQSALIAWLVIEVMEGEPCE